MRLFRSTDGTDWAVDVKSPSNSNAMVVFRHGDGRTSSRDRYAWYQWHGSEARNVTARLDPDEVLERLSEADLIRLFRRSMPVTTQQPAAVRLPAE